MLDRALRHSRVWILRPHIWLVDKSHSRPAILLQEFLDVAAMLEDHGVFIVPRVLDLHIPGDYL
jgi:hypothetical protein